MRNNTADHLFEALFRQAVIDNFEEGMRTIPSEEDLSRQYAFSKEHAYRMEKLFKTAERAEKLQAKMKWIRRSAAVLIISFTALVCTLMTVPEVRAVVAKVVIEWFDQFTKFSSEQADPDEMQEWEPRYVPAGFTVTGRSSFPGMYSFTYMDSDGQMLEFTCMISSGSISVDNENQNYFMVDTDKMVFHVFESTDPAELNMIIWDDEDYRFCVESTLPIDELLPIAESTEKK